MGLAQSNLKLLPFFDREHISLLMQAHVGMSAKGQALIALEECWTCLSCNACD